MAYHQMVGWMKTSDLLETFTLCEGPPYSGNGPHYNNTGLQKEIVKCV